MKRKLFAFLSVILCLAMLLGTFAFAEEAPAETEAPIEPVQPVGRFN